MTNCSHGAYCWSGAGISKTNSGERTRRTPNKKQSNTQSGDNAYEHNDG